MLRIGLDVEGERWRVRPLSGFCDGGDNNAIEFSFDFDFGVGHP
jgi:hypothetical protein